MCNSGIIFKFLNTHAQNHLINPYILNSFCKIRILLMILDSQIHDDFLNIFSWYHFNSNISIKQVQHHTSVYVLLFIHWNKFPGISDIQFFFFHSTYNDFLLLQVIQFFYCIHLDSLYIFWGIIKNESWNL